VKAPAAKFGRSNRLGRASRSRAEGVPGIKRSIATRLEQFRTASVLDQCPTNQSAAVDDRANHGLRRDQTAKCQQRGDENERREKQELGKITELAHFHDKTPEALVWRQNCKCSIPEGFQCAMSIGRCQFSSEAARVLPSWRLPHRAPKHHPRPEKKAIAPPWEP